MSSGTTSESRPWSLAARLTLWYAGSAFLLILVATVALDVALAAHLDEEQDELLGDQVRLLTGLLNDYGDDSRELRQAIDWEFAARRRARFRIRILDAAGR